MKLGEVVVPKCTYFLIHLFLLIHFYMNWPLMCIITRTGNKVATFETNFFHDTLKILLCSQERKNLTDTKIMPPLLEQMLFTEQ